MCLEDHLSKLPPKERRTIADQCAKAVEEMSADRQAWLRMMQPTIPRAAALNTNASSPSSQMHHDSYLQQPSLLRILLCSEFLQSALLPIVLERLGSLEHQPGSGDDRSHRKGSCKLQCRDQTRQCRCGMS